MSNIFNSCWASAIYLGKLTFPLKWNAEKKTELKESERLCRADASYISFHFFNSQPSHAVPTASGHFEDYLCLISLDIHFIQAKHHVFFLFAFGLKWHIILPC